MTQHPVTDLLSRWPDRQAIHSDVLAADPSLDIIAVHRWFQRHSIPQKHWAALVDGAKRRGFRLSADELMRAHGAAAESSDHVGSHGVERRQRKGRVA